MNRSPATPNPIAVSTQQLLAENELLRTRLDEAEDALRAIRNGEVDALVLPGPDGEAVYTLKSADHAFRVLVEEMQEGAVVVDDGGMVMYANRRFSEMLKLSLEHVTAHSFFEWVTDLDQSLIKTMLSEAHRGTAKGEYRLTASDGGEMPVYLSVSPFSMDERPVLCLVVTDLTDRKRTEQVLAAEQIKDKFLATLSHELRTPLNPVMAMVQLMQMDPNISPEMRESLQMIRRNVELEVRLIDDLLDVTKIARGKVELHRESMDVHAAMKSAIEINQSEIAGKQLTVSMSLWAQDHHAWADPARVQQVFWNLLKNAVKFTPRHGKIDIRSSNLDGKLRVEVADTGIGIEPQLTDKLFNAFEQGDRAITRQFGGLGLGLSIARALAEMHEGTLVASSKGLGKGAAFTLELPTVRPQPAENTAASRAFSQAAASVCRILLVEDHLDTATVMARLLRSTGYFVKTATTCADALTAAAADHFDLMISDIGLPDGTGNDLMMEITRRFNLKGIALSGYGTEEDIRQSRQAGFADHVVKPINFAILQSVIARLTGKSMIA